MKKILAFLLLIIPLSQSIFSQTDSKTLYTAAESSENPSKQIAINPKTGFPAITEKPFLMYNEGISFAQVTRIEKQDGKSNFGWEDYMIGAYFSLQTGNIKPFDLTLRTCVYYPFKHTFEGQTVPYKQVILYAFDLFVGPTFQFNFWNYLRLNLSPGLHYMYQLTDEYHLNYLGLGGIAGLELPVSRHCNLLVDGSFTLDYPNFGTNQKIQPFNYAWQYQVSVGFRYSLANPNRFSYLQTSKDRMINEGIIADPVLQKRAQKDAERKIRKAQNKENREKMRYMTTGEKEVFKKQIKADRAAEKKAKKEAQIEEKLRVKEARKTYLEDAKLTKQIKKQARIDKKETEKNKEKEVIPSLIVRLRGKHSTKYLCSYSFTEVENNSEKIIAKDIITDYEKLLKKSSLKVRANENINFQFSTDPKEITVSIWNLSSRFRGKICSYC